MAKRTTTADSSAGNDVKGNGSEKGTTVSNNTKKRGKKNDAPRCHVCGREAAPDLFLYQGEFDENCYICADCVEQLHMLNMSIDAQIRGDINPERALEENQNDDYTVDRSKYVPSPHEIVEYLNKHIISQDQAKRDIAVCMYNHLRMINSPEDTSADGVKLRTNNIICLGPSGSGKTEIFRRLTEWLDIPFIIFDISSCTQAGFVGMDIEDMLVRMIQKCDGDIKKAEKSIIMIDEVDKISRNTHYDKSNNGDHKSSINSLGVQAQLLKYLDGGEVSLNIQQNGHGEKLITIDTSKILFILNGAFIGLDKIINNRLNRKPSVGFNLSDSEGASGKTSTKSTTNVKKNVETDDYVIKYAKPADIITYGFMAEIVGRAGNITFTRPLSRDDLKRVLTEPQNSVIKEYKKRLELDGKTLTFTDEALDWICDDAISNETGARGLRASVNKIMSKIMFDAPSDPDLKDIVIDMDYIHSAVEEADEEIKQKEKFKA